MTMRWNVTFMDNDEPIGSTTVEAPDEQVAQDLAREQHPIWNKASNGRLVMEEHALKPEEAVAVLGEIWDNLCKLELKQGKTPSWEELDSSARAAWVHYVREVLSEPIEQIGTLVQGIHRRAKARTN